MSRIHRQLLALSTGVLLSLAWLSVPGWTLFCAFIPLLLLDQFYVDNKAQYKSASFWGYAFFSFLIWNIITTWWIAYATVVGAMLAILANSFLMSLVWWFGHAARRRFKPNLGYIALVVFWISFEYFHYHWDIEWPWLNLGNGFANNIKLIQWYEYTGTLGGTLWVLTVNIVLFRLFVIYRNRISGKHLIFPASSIVLLIAVPIIISYNLFNSYVEKVNPLDVVIVQPNINPYSERYDFEAEEEKLQSFIGLADKKTTQQTDLIIGPETLFERWPDWNNERLHQNILYNRLIGWLNDYPETNLIFGASTHKLYPSADSASSTARESNGTYYDVYNSAIFIGRDDEQQFYHKSILVPGVEKMPLQRYLWLLNDVVFDLGGTTGSLGRMKEPSNFLLNQEVGAAPVICYESVFGGYLAEFVRKGAEMIVIITNDGWWRNTPGYKQHFSFARLRAIETRRSVARAANTGISGFINQRGEAFQTTSWWTPTVVAGSINLNDEITFYVRYGDYIARISLFAGALLGLFLLVRTFIRE